MSRGTISYVYKVPLIAIMVLLVGMPGGVEVNAGDCLWRCDTSGVYFCPTLPKKGCIWDLSCGTCEDGCAGSYHLNAICTMGTALEDCSHNYSNCQFQTNWVKTCTLSCLCPFLGAFAQPCPGVWSSSCSGTSCPGK